MAHMENLSIGVFIDGGYFAKIDEGLAKAVECLAPCIIHEPKPTTMAWA